MKREHKIAAGLGPALVILIVIAVFSYRSTTQLIATSGQVEQSHVVLETLGDLLSHTIDAESSARGYVIAGDDFFLEPYRTRSLSVRQNLSRLRVLTTDNPAQRRRLDALQPVIDERLKRLEWIIELRQKGGYEAAATQVRTTTGKQMMDEIRRRIDEMQGEERTRLSERSAAVHSKARRTTREWVGGSMASFVLLLLVILLLNREVGQRQQAEQQSRRSANYARSLIEVSLDPLVTISKNGRIMDANRAAEQATGVSRERLIGSDFCDYFTEPEKARQGYKQVFSQGLVRDYPLAVRDTSGRVTDVLYNATVFRNEAGEVEGVFAAARDISERKRAEEGLQRALREWKATFDAMDDCICLLDRDGTIRQSNQSMSQLLHLPADSIIGRKCFELVHGSNCYLEDCPYRKMLQTAKSESIELRLGDRCYIVSAHPYLGDGGEITGAVHTLHDITERKHAEQEIRRMNAELEDRVTARTAELAATVNELQAFTYSVSHDLRAPLRQVNGFAKLLAEEFGPGLDTKAQEYLTWVQDGTRRMGQLVDDLLNLSRVGRRELRPQLTGMNSLVQEVVAELGAETKGREIDWQIGDLPFVECDPALMRQVWANLLSNAVKFTRPRKCARIEVGKTECAGRPAIFVRDNGVGFSMKYVNKLFGVFQRLHREEDFEGTGVGLATVQRIILKHGGSIWAEAELDKGAAFYFTLGAAEDGAAANESESEEVQFAEK